VETVSELGGANGQSNVSEKARADRFNDDGEKIYRRIHDLDYWVHCVEEREVRERRTRTLTGGMRSRNGAEMHRVVNHCREGKEAVVGSPPSTGRGISRNCLRRMSEVKPVKATLRLHFFSRRAADS
jgi:hypothetical protein